jgi:hypothetical protein
MALLPAALRKIFKRTVFPKMFSRLAVKTPLTLRGFSTPRFWREISLSNKPDRTFCFVPVSRLPSFSLDRAAATSSLIIFLNDISSASLSF